MLRKAYLALLIIVIGLNASLEALPKDVVVSLGFNPYSATPANPGPYGTSELVELLREEGYRVSVVSSLADLAYLPGINSVDRVIVSLIAPDKISSDELDSLLALASRPNTSFLIASENTEGFTAYLAYNITRAKCGLPVAIEYPERSSLYNATSHSALIIGLPGGQARVLPTGYVSRVVLYTNTTPKMHGLPPVRVTGDAYIIAIATLPAGYALSLGANMSGYRFVAGVACGGGRGGVVVLGDSTIFTNMALSASPSYRKVAAEVYHYLSNGEPSSSLVVFIADIYTGNSSARLRFHPSILLTSLALRYKTLEDEAISFLEARPYLAALLIALFGLLIYSSMPGGSWRRVPRELARPPAVQQPPRFLGEPREGGAGLEALDLTALCVMADTLVRRRLGVSIAQIALDPGVARVIRERELRDAVVELSLLCSRGKPGPLERLLSFLGIVEDRRGRALRLLDRLWRRLGGL